MRGDRDKLKTQWSLYFFFARTEPQGGCVVDALFCANTKGFGIINDWWMLPKASTFSACLEIK